MTKTPSNEQELFTEYRYAPPNVKAIRWDGKLATAQAIVAYFSEKETVERRGEPHHENPLYVKHEIRGDGHQTTDLFFGTTKVARGDFIVIEPDGRVHLSNKTEFPYNYTEVPSPFVVTIRVSQEQYDEIIGVPHTIEDDDYLPPDLGEHPPTTQLSEFAAAIQRSTLSHD